MTLEMWFAFVVAGAVLSVLPGPSMLLVMAHAMAIGVRPTFCTIGGVVLGNFVLICLSLLGVGAILVASSELFVLMKWIGALYLIYLGIRQWRAPIPVASSAAVYGEPASLSLFTQGLAVTVVNPKVIAFFVAFFPQFINPNGDLTVQMIILGTTFLLLVFPTMVLYAAMAGGLRRLFKHTSWMRMFNRAAGGLMIGAAFVMISLRRS